jgi:hypothetical protein
MKHATGMKRKVTGQHMVYASPSLKLGGSKLLSVRCDAKFLLDKVRRDRVG